MPLPSRLRKFESPDQSFPQRTRLSEDDDSACHCQLISASCLSVYLYLTTPPRRCVYFLRSAIASSTALRNCPITSAGDCAEKTDVPATITFDPTPLVSLVASHLGRSRKQLTSLGTLTDIPRPDPAIHLDILVPSEPFPELLDFLQTLGHEFLPALARVNGHDEDHIGLRECRIRDR